MACTLIASRKVVVLGNALNVHDYLPCTEQDNDNFINYYLILFLADTYAY